MKVSTTWLQSYLGRTMSPRQLADALELAGVEVEQINVSLAIDPLVVVGLVKKCVQHPNADKLKVATVELPGQTLSIVCGAPNVRAGLKVAVAQIGATLSGGEAISRVKLRGEVSEGMLCSPRELGLSDDHAGLLELPDDVALGTPLGQLYPADGQLDLKTAANRPDLQSVVGLAREVAAQTKAPLKVSLPTAPKAGKGPTVKMEVEPKVVGRFAVAELSLNQANTYQEAPPQEVGWLRTSGMRSLSPVVDVTNFVMLEQGQPLHAYDADKVKGAIIVRHAAAGEHLTTLDGVKRKLTKADLVIADDRGPIGLAGVMGGAATEVGPKTKRIYLEAATFDGATVRKMALRHGLRSEASARFERGLPVQLAPVALARAIEVLGKDAKLVGATDELRVWPWEQRIGLRRSQLVRLLGFEVSFDDAIAALGRLGIEARQFDVVAEAKSHLGKPYVWGARYKTHGTDAFDCGYYLDYLYSLIGYPAGHTAPQLMESGQPVELADLKPGDTLYRDGAWKELKREDRNGVSHVAMYLGDGKIIHAENYHLVKGEWQELPTREQKVMVDDLKIITEAPGFLGARRHLADLDDFISVPVAPWWRPDLKVGEDLVEEIVKVLGYDAVPATLPPWRPTEVEFDQQRVWRRRIQEVLFGAGLFEVMTYSFVSEDQIKLLGSDPKHYLKLKNPLSQEQAYLRRSPLPSLLAALERNAKYAPEAGVYEVTAVFEPAGKGELPQEPERLAVLWRRRDGSYAAVKGVLDALAEALSLDLVAELAEDGRFAPGRGGVAKLGDAKVGWIGQVAPALVRRHKLSGEIAYLELELAPLRAAGPRQYDAPSRFPVAYRDLTVVVPVEVTWQQVKDEAAHAGLARVIWRSDYYGPELPEGRKSVSFRLEMSSPDHTLSEAEVTDRLTQIESRLKKRLGAESR